MTLADRLNIIIKEQKITKKEFATRLGVSVNYIYILTENLPSREKVNKKISPALAKLISLEFGYDEKWILGVEKLQTVNKNG